VATLVRGAKLQINSTDSILLPAGTNAQRPGSSGGTDTAGMFRFSTTATALEVYDGAAWSSLTSAFTVITDENFNGDSSEVNFTMAAATTTAATIVSINGILQIPTLAYSVSGTTLTFTEAPQTGDLIDVRRLATTSTVTQIASTNGYMSIELDDAGTYFYTGTSSPTLRTKLFSNGAMLSNAGISSTNISTGTIIVDGGVGISGALNVGANVTVTGNVLPSANVTYDLGSASQRWKDLWLSGSTIYLAGATISGTGGQVTITNPLGGSFSVTGSAAGQSTANFGNLVANSGIASTSTSTGALQITGGAGISGAAYIGGIFTSSGNIVAASNTTSTSATTGALVVAGGVGIAGNVFTAGWIVPTANTTQNLGTTTSWWGTLYGVSTQAKYADLAENYQADNTYAPGVVLMFGGDQEVTIATADTTAVAGVVSQNPAHLMNGGLSGTNVVPLALQGRVPCNVIGPIKKGDLMISAGFGYAKATTTPKFGQIIGKALSDFAGARGQIEVVVGRT
jgi:cytoskeletal protein CcmA (bactofilin family)